MASVSTESPTESQLSVSEVSSDVSSSLGIRIVGPCTLGEGMILIDGITGG